MSDNPRNVLVEELELSVRSSEFLMGLSVTTVGDLLDLPAIVLPDDWPVRMAQLVAAELREALSDLGVEYAGEIRVP